jgi:hypothetical protein
MFRFRGEGSDRTTLLVFAAETVLKGLYAEVGWNVAVTWTTPSSEGPKAVAAQ